MCGDISSLHSELSGPGLTVVHRFKAIASLKDGLTVQEQKELAHLIAEESGRPITGARLDVANGIFLF